MLYYPTFYSDTEGGVWKRWPNRRPIQEEELVLDKALKHVVIDGILVHSLAFEDPAAGFWCFGRWDCINGWTLSIDEAKRRFPNGLHNLPWRK